MSLLWFLVVMIGMTGSVLGSSTSIAITRLKHRLEVLTDPSDCPHGGPWADSSAGRSTNS
jgi:hypothetical protein